MVMAPATSYASQEKIEFEIHYFFDGVAAIMASAMAQLWTSSKYSFKLWAILSSHRNPLPQKQLFATTQYRDLQQYSYSDRQKTPTYSSRCVSWIPMYRFIAKPAVI